MVVHLIITTTIVSPKIITIFVIKHTALWNCHQCLYWPWVNSWYFYKHEMLNVIFDNVCLLVMQILLDFSLDCQLFSKNASAMWFLKQTPSLASCWRTWSSACYVSYILYMIKGIVIANVCIACEQGNMSIFGYFTWMKDRRCVVIYCRKILWLLCQFKRTILIHCPYFHDHINIGKYFAAAVIQCW